MKNISKRENILIGSMLVAIVLYIYYTLFLSPVIGKQLITKSAINNYIAEINSLKAAKLSNTDLQAKLQQAQTKYNDAIKVLPLTERQPDIAYRLKSLSDLNKVTLKTVNFGQAAESGNNKTNNAANQNVNNSLNKNLMISTANIAISGTYNNVMNFVSSVEKDSRIAEITNATLTSNSSELTADITINYYYSAKGSANDASYDFNNGSYGKEDLFR